MATTNGARPSRGKSQKTYVLEALQKGAKITPITALNSWGIMRLAAIICTLNKEGYQIDTKMVKGRTGNKFAQYSL
jgi:hypothetical protein